MKKFAILLAVLSLTGCAVYPYPGPYYDPYAYPVYPSPVIRQAPVYMQPAPVIVPVPVPVYPHHHHRR